MTYQEFIHNLRAISCYTNSPPSYDEVETLFLRLNKQDPELCQIIADHCYCELPKVPVMHKEQGFELRLLQTGDNFDSEIHDHPQRDVYGFVIKGNIEMTLYDFIDTHSNDQKVIQKISHHQYAAGDYFFIGKVKNNIHHILSQTPALVLELIMPCVTAKLAEKSLKYSVENTLSENVYQVDVLQDDI